MVRVWTGVYWPPSESDRHPRVLSIRVGETFLCLNSINFPARFACRGIKRLSDVENSVNTRANSNGNLVVNEDTFINDATKAWNKAPSNIKESESIFTAKRLIKQYVKKLLMPKLIIKVLILKVIDK